MVAPEAQLTTSITSTSSDCSTSTGACPKTPPTAGRVPAPGQVSRFSEGVKNMRLTEPPISSPRIRTQWLNNNSRCVPARRRCFKPGLSPEVHNSMLSRPRGHSLSTTWSSRRQPSQRALGSTSLMLLRVLAITSSNFRRIPQTFRSG